MGKLAALMLLLAPLQAQIATGVIPLDVVLLVEDSALATNAVKTVRIDTLHSGDRVALMTFSDSSAIRSGFVEDVRSLDRSIQHLKSRRRPRLSRLWDAVADAAGIFPGPADPARKRVILLLYSQRNQSKRETPESVRRLLIRGDIALSSLSLMSAVKLRHLPAYPPPSFPPRRALTTPQDHTQEGVEQIVAATAGVNLKPTDAEMMFAIVRPPSATTDRRPQPERVQ